MNVKSLIKCAVALLALFGASRAMAQCAVSIPDLIVEAGETKVELPISLTNDEDVRDFQMDLYLPDGITIAKNNRGRLMVSLTDRAEYHTLSTNDFGDGHYRVAAISLEGDYLYDNDGEVLSCTLALAADLADGIYAVRIDNIRLSRDDGSEILCPSCSAKIYVGECENDPMVLSDEVPYTIEDVIEGIDFTYTATYSKTDAPKAWRPVYVPFEMPASEFAKVVTLSSLSDGLTEDGDALVFDVVDANDMLKPNTPYAVLLKDGRNTIEYSVTQGTLYPPVIFGVSSEGNFWLWGNYILRTDMATSGYYAIAADGAFHPAASDAAVLKPYRFYLTVPDGFNAQTLRIKVRGEETEGLESLFFNTDGDAIYDLSGRRVANPTDGIYIINGHKAIIK